MKSLDSTTTPQMTTVSPQIKRRLDQVMRSVMGLRMLAAAGRLFTVGVALLLTIYFVDRALHLPRAVRGFILFFSIAGLLRETWKWLLCPLCFGLDREDAARLVERECPEIQGRIMTALQVGGGSSGSMEEAVSNEAETLCQERDLRDILSPGPSLSEVWKGLALAGIAGACVFFLNPPLAVFGQRWMLDEVSWPRQTHLTVSVPERGVHHLRLPDGDLVAVRGGVIDVEVNVVGLDPERVELLVETDQGDRQMYLSPQGASTYRGHFRVESGDRSLRVRGGDDPGLDVESIVQFEVIEPPRLVDPMFVLDPPAYTGRGPSTVGPEGLVVPEGTLVTLQGTTRGIPESATLWLAGSGRSFSLDVQEDGVSGDVRGNFVASDSESFFVQLVGAHGLSVPEPVSHALVVLKDRAPGLKVFVPGKSDMKVTARAVVPFGVLAEDDYGVTGVSLTTEELGERLFSEDQSYPGHYRLLLDLGVEDLATVGTYSIAAQDGRDLPGLGPHTTMVEGRRLDVVDEGEVRRLLSDRQLRLKESFIALRERQHKALVVTEGLLADLPPRDDPDFVAAVVSQQQVLSRMERESKELCAIVDETIFNRLDPGPGEPAVLAQRLENWSKIPVDEIFSPESWRYLAEEYKGGKYGRLDLLGRLLEMVSLSLDLLEVGVPKACALVSEARSAPGVEIVQALSVAQRGVLSGFDRLLERMDEWEDYQEVLSLLKVLIEDQEGLRDRTKQVLGERKVH